MDNYFVMKFVDPKTNKSVKDSITPSAVLDTIEDVVGRYVASQKGTSAARAWGQGLNHVPFLTPADQLKQTQTVTRPERDDGYAAIVTGLVLEIAPEAKQFIDNDDALKQRLSDIGREMHQTLMDSTTYRVLLVLMTALPSDSGNLSTLKVYLVDRLTKTIQTTAIHPSLRHLRFEDVTSAYKFDFGRMADAADVATWKRFVSETKPAEK